MENTETVEHLYSPDDYLETEKPYVEVLDPVIEIPFALEQAREKLRADAIGQGIKAKTIDAMLDSYIKSAKQQLPEEPKQKTPSATGTREVEINGLKLELPEGWDWDGWEIRRVYQDERGSFQTASYHPIFPIKRAEDIDGGGESLAIVYKLNKELPKDEGWKEFTDTKTAFFDSSKVLKLSEKCGIAVNTSNAKLLAQYLCETAQENYPVIPTVMQTHKAGWNRYGFAPYKQAAGYPVELVGMPELAAKGSLDKWKDEVIKSCASADEIKIIMGTAAISPMIKWLGLNNFIVHLMSDLSGSGKTVTLMMAASLWGNPEKGQYLRRADTTNPAVETLCAKLQDLPLILDEMQTAKDARGRSKFSVYKVAEGGGRSKMGKDGELLTGSAYHLTILTSGESSIIKQEDGEGAYNRTLEVELNRVLYDNGREVADFFRGNYGVAAEPLITYFVENHNEIISNYNNFYDAAVVMYGKGYGAKQLQMAVAVTLGYKILNDAVLGDEAPGLGIEKVIKHCKSLKGASVTEREYEDLVNWVSGNDIHFRQDLDRPVEQWGEYDAKDDSIVWIFQRVFSNFLRDSGYEPRGAKQALKNAGYIAKGRPDRHNFSGKTQAAIPLVIKDLE